MVERNLAKVKVGSSRLLSRSRILKGTACSRSPSLFPVSSTRRGGRVVMQRPANPRFSGAMAEWSCSGLQIRLRRFDSGSRLQISVTDPSVEGLPPGEPVIVAAGMQGERASVVIEQSACGRWRSEEIIPESYSANTSLRCLRTWSEHGTNTTRRGVKYRYKGMTGYDPKRTFAYSSGEQSRRCNYRGASVNGTDAPRAAYSFGRYPASMDCRAELQRLATRWTRNAARNNRMQVSRSDTNA